MSDIPRIPRSWFDRAIGVLLTGAVALMGYVAEEAVTTKNAVIRVEEQVKWRLQSLEERVKIIEDTQRRIFRHDEH